MYDIDSHQLDAVNALEFYLQKLHQENPNLFAKCKKLFSKVGKWNLVYERSYRKKHPC